MESTKSTLGECLLDRVGNETFTSFANSDIRCGKGGGEEGGGGGEGLEKVCVVCVCMCVCVCVCGGGGGGGGVVCGRGEQFQANIDY